MSRCAAEVAVWITAALQTAAMEQSKRTRFLMYFSKSDGLVKRTPVTVIDCITSTLIGLLMILRNKTLQSQNTLITVASLKMTQ